MEIFKFPGDIPYFSGLEYFSLFTVQGDKNARKMREALQKRADNAEKCVSQIRARQHSNEELAHAAEVYQQHRWALEGYQCISNAGLTADTRHIPLTGIRGMSEVPKVRLSPQCEMRGTSEVPQWHNSLMRELLIPPPIIGQGHMEVTSSTSSSDRVTRMVWVALEENRDTVMIQRAYAPAASDQAFWNGLDWSRLSGTLRAPIFLSDRPSMRYMWQVSRLGIRHSFISSFWS